MLSKINLYAVFWMIKGGGNKSVVFAWSLKPDQAFLTSTSLDLFGMFWPLVAHFFPG